MDSALERTPEPTAEVATEANEPPREVASERMEAPFVPMMEVASPNTEVTWETRLLRSWAETEAAKKAVVRRLRRILEADMRSRCL